MITVNLPSSSVSLQDLAAWGSQVTTGRAGPAPESTQESSLLKIACCRVWMLTQILKRFYCKYQINWTFLSFRLLLWRTWTDLDDWLEVDHCTHPSVQLSIPSASASSLLTPACNPRRPIIHFLFAQPCLLDSCSGEKGKSISQVPAPPCKSAFIELLESDMTRFSCIDGVAAQNTENSAGDGKAEGCAREGSCSWLIFSQNVAATRWN